ncbi:hypothetical protein [Reyranella sp.]|uniref:hypothetical protein n=1 Tax=Reyranella sp. TaxID=1929291 RepID=UPI003D120FF9
MSRRKSFVYDMYPQDFNDGVKGLPDEVVGVYIKLINLMRVEAGPLPPRRLKMARTEFDEWIRDKLGHKNVRTWLRAKRVLLADPDKLIELPDGRVANPRTERDVATKRAKDGSGGGGAADDQNVLPFDRVAAPPVDRPVDSPVDDEGEAREKPAASGEVRAKFDRTSGEVRSIRASNPLKSHDFRCASPYPYIRIPLRAVVADHRYPRARGDPAGLRA